MDGQVPAQGPLGLDTEHNSLESISILCTHHIVKNRIECRGEEIEASGEVEEYLIDGSVEGQVLEVDIAKSLEVERSPGNKEKNNNRD